MSRATVSRAFGQPHLLSRDTVELVLGVARRLGYVPNHTARALSTGRAGNIALVVPDITNSFFAALMRGAQAKARDEGYATFLGDSDEMPDVEDMLLTKLAAQVDGFILVSSRLSEESILEHAKRRPFVLINRDVAQLPHLLIDTGPSYAQAVEHLAGLGHRSLAYVAGPTLSWSNRERHAAVEATARRLGIGLVRIETSRPSFEAGQACAGELIAAGVTAALAFDDVMAQGIMAGLAGRGLAVPRDFSLVGCDGVLATTTYPPLTSVETHCFAAGTQAVALLFEVLRGAAPPHAGLRLPTELIIRQTTAPPGASRPVEPPLLPSRQHDDPHHRGRAAATTE
ncbi:LacI family DNA-binding transcriptional regulator [Labrys monachus]|uniref:LacI family transcriptional regulator n=1 Tax=Labrys monachus TaxID=217067 RepID=A0ABU0FIQ7_9HYPH|nr:LacI family transcriptional regulator [Labrys monachus]